MMEIRMEILDAAIAGGARGFILPGVAESEDFDSFAFYGALADGRLAALLVADPRLFEPEILSIAVSPEYQGMGLATGLLTFAVTEMMQDYEEEGELENRFLSTVLGSPEPTAAVRRVLEKCGFEAANEGGFYEATVGMLQDNRIVQDSRVIARLREKDGEIVALKEIDNRLARSFGNELAEQGEIPGVRLEELDEDISFFLIQKGTVRGAILFLKEEDGAVQNLFLHWDKDAKLKPRLLTYLLTASSSAALKKFPEETRISFFAGDPETLDLIRRAFPGAVPKETFTRYELPFAKLTWDPAERFTDDPGFRPVENKNMVCARCAHCTASVLSCEKYAQKPDGVVEGGSCELFEAVTEG